MATRYLGMGFDLHGGGSDLIFPHHENEIAQAEGLAGSEPFARHWMHAGMVQMDAEKMSKSLGNIALAKEVIARYGGEAARYWCLMGSYRSQVAFSSSALEDAAQAYERWRTFVGSARHALGELAEPQPVARPVDSEGLPEGYVTRFIEAMDDDFNSAGALAVVHDLVREANKLIEDAGRGDAEARMGLQRSVDQFREITTVLGFGFEEAEEEDSELTGNLIELLLELRDKARAEKAFERADEIRDRLTELGVAVEDTASGARWRVTRRSPAHPS